MYAMVCTRPDIAHAVGVVSRYLLNPGKQHWEESYLRGTKKLLDRERNEESVFEGRHRLC
jgi:hypothetical protein